jgi:hypothetical protein
VRIRSTKPEFWRSERIASVSWDARLVLKGLESFVDDNGVGKDDIALIVGDLFQRDLIREASRTLARLTEALVELSEAGLLWRYEVDGTKLLFIAFWEDVQRIDHAAKGRFPRPDGTWNYGESKIRESLATSREASLHVAPGTGEQGNRGTDTSCASDDAPERFDEFWNTYAKKVDRKKAEQKYKLALKKPGVTPDLLITSARSYVEFQQHEGKHPQFTKDPVTWLNNESWANEITARTSRQEPSGGDYYDIFNPQRSA